MTPPKVRYPAPRVTLSVAEAADALGLGQSVFTAEVLPKLRVIRLGRRQLIPVRELERWADAAAQRFFTDDA